MTGLIKRYEVLEDYVHGGAQPRKKAKR